MVNKDVYIVSVSAVLWRRISWLQSSVSTLITRRLYGVRLYHAMRAAITSGVLSIKAESLQCNSSMCTALLVAMNADQTGKRWHPGLCC